MQASRLVRRHTRPVPTDLCTAFCSLYIAARGLNTSAIHRAAGGSNNATPNPMRSAPAGTTKRGDKAAAQIAQAPAQSPAAPVAVPGELTVSEQLKQQEVAAKAQKELDQRKKNAAAGPKQGSLAKDNIFDFLGGSKLGTGYPQEGEEEVEEKGGDGKLTPISQRNPQYMEQELNPRPDARARWMRKRVIKNIQKRGRITREMHLARTERQHTVQSHFFKTSIKKLAPLARQIAGKSIDEAIVQMRFSVKKAAKQVLKHLIHARNEAIVIRGMGLSVNEGQSTSAVNVQNPKIEIGSLIKQALNPQSVNETAPTTTDTSTPLAQSAPAEIINPSNTPPLANQNPDKSIKAGLTANPTDIYVAQAWVNRGKYGKKMMARARGRGDIQRPPRTGISVMLKEEKTRTREQYEKEIKAIRKRLNGNLWTQLPDRPVTRQSQYVLW